MFQAPQSLLDAVRAGTVIPFVGAGISVGAVASLAPAQRFPDWLGLIERLAARLAVEDPAAAAQVRAALPDTMAAAQLAVERLGRPLFLDEMTQAFGRRQAPVGADLSAAMAIWRLQAPFVITTNYDMVLEWPWAPGEVQRIHNDEPTPLQMLQTASTRRRVWHLHGSIDRVDTIILTSQQYLKLYPDETDPKRVDYQNAFEQFKQLLKTRSFLFLGFSLAEPVLRRKLDEVMALTEQTAPVKFLLLRAGQADDAKKQDFMDRYNVRVIEFADFGAPMIAAIDAIGAGPEATRQRVASAALTPDMRPLVAALFEQLAGLALPPQTVARLYNAAKPPAWAAALTGGDGFALLRDAVVQLGGAVARSDDGVPPLLDFVNRLKREVTEPWLTRLSRWLDDALARLATDEQRAALAQRLADAQTPAAGERLQVLVRIRPDAEARGEWLLHAWSWAGTRVAESLFGAEGRRVAAGASGEVVLALVDELEARNADPALTAIAFAVPNAIACEAIHAWRLPAEVADDPPIGATYVVTLRPLVRLERAPLVRRRFKKAWDEFKQRAAGMLAVLDDTAHPPPGSVPALWLDASAALHRDLAATLAQRGARCVVLREAPCAAAIDPLVAIVDTATPVIAWWDGGDAPADVDAAMRALLQSVPLAELPRRVRDERAAAFRDASGLHPGMKLTLVWDDADFMPPETDPHARARLETT